MVVRYACIACGPTYFTTYQRATVHYARTAACNQSLLGIAFYCATVQLTWTQADLGLLGYGLDRRKMQVDVHIRVALAPALQVTEIARSYVWYMTSIYIS